SEVSRMQRTSAAAVCVALTIGVLSGPAYVYGQMSKRPIVLDDLAKFRTVGDSQVSPDGKWVAYTVETVDVDKDGRDTDLWMTSWDGSRQIRLTWTPERSERMPRWSPDNRYLAFLASRGGEENRTVGAQV